MSDISDLDGVFPTPFRWNAQLGTANYFIYHEATGDRELKEIELGSSTAKFVIDLATRARGYGKVKTGVYDMMLTPVGSPPPPRPDDPEYKPALGLWLWNPQLGELRLETNATLLVRVIAGLWDRCRTFSEASQGLQPVIHFVDRRQRPIASLNKVFYEPVIDIVGWFKRGDVPPFQLREPTVAPAPELPDIGVFQIHNNLAKPASSPTAAVSGLRSKVKSDTFPGALNDEHDDGAAS
jgi:hypothetical protein